MSSSLYLPFTDEHLSVVELSLTIYKKWFGLSAAAAQKIVVPESFKDQRQYLYQEMIKQLSVIFEKRTNPKSMTEKYNTICKDVLKIYSAIANELSNAITESTWNMLLRVNIGIADKFLSEPKSTTDPSEQIAIVLADHLFDLWLRSGVQEPRLFSYLSYYASGWTHRENVVQVWVNLCKGLTQRVLRILYDTPCSFKAKYLKPIASQPELYDSFEKDQGRYVIVLPYDSKEPNTARVYNLSDEQLVYLWMRFMLLFERRITFDKMESGTDNKKVLLFNQHESYQLYFKCLADILKEFSNVGRVVNRPEKDVLYDNSEVDKAVKIMIPSRFPQSETFRDEFRKFIIETVGERKKTLSPAAIPSGNIILKIFGVNFFEATYQVSQALGHDEKVVQAVPAPPSNPSPRSSLTTYPEPIPKAPLHSYEYEESAYSELCKLFSNFPGPFSHIYPAWFYYRLKGFFTKHMDKLKLGVSNNIILNSTRLFLSGLHGIHTLAPLFATAIKEVMSSDGMNNHKVVRVCLKILSQIISLPSNFKATEVTVLKEEKATLALSHLNRYMEMQNTITAFLDMETQESRVSSENVCALLWIGALNTLQNKQPKEYLDYIVCVVIKCFYERFDIDIFDPKKVSTISVALDIFEMLVTVIHNQSDSGISHHLNVIACQLIVLADDKVPMEGTAMLKKLMVTRHYGYEKLLCRMIQLCLMASNTNPTATSEATISCLKSIIVKTRKGMANEKMAKYFGYGYVESVAVFALSFIALNTQKHRISTLTPNLDSVFCNKYPKDTEPSLYSPSVPKTHVIVSGESRIITICELQANNRLYDLLVVVRDEMGHFAYRAQLMCNIRQLTEFLSDSAADASGSSSSGGKPEKVESHAERNEMVIDRNIPGIEMNAEEAEAQKHIEELLKTQAVKEKETITKRPEKIEKLETEHRKSQVNTSTNTLARIFLKHFQFIQGRRLSSVCILQETPEFLNELKAIDVKSLRQVQMIPILYYKSSTSPQYEANYGSNDPYFNDIISELGIVLEDKHIKTGNFDHLQELVQDVGLVYNTGLFYEQVFIAPTLKLSNKMVRLITWCKI